MRQQLWSGSFFFLLGGGGGEITETLWNFGILTEIEFFDDPNFLSLLLLAC
jgi:hypothetical protein